MREVARELAKYITEYYVAHSRMVDAMLVLKHMRTAQHSLQYLEAEAKLTKAQAALVKRLPDTVSVRDVLREFMIFIQETQRDPFDLD